METVQADDKQRVRLPDAKPGQVFALVNNPDGSFTLALVKPDAKERPFDHHLYDDLDGERLQEQQALEAASAKVDISAEERDRE